MDGKARQAGFDIGVTAYGRRWSKVLMGSIHEREILKRIMAFYSGLPEIQKDLRLTNDLCLQIASCLGAPHWVPFEDNLCPHLRALQRKVEA